MAVSFILGTATASAQAQQKPFGYLIDAANQIKQIEYAHAVVTREGNARIAKLACDALTRLSQDDQLRVAVNEVSRNTDANRGAAGRLLENLAEFNASFLPAEADLMRSQDLDYAAIVDVLQVALNTRTTTKVGGLTQEAIIASINRGREQVCQFAAAAVSDRQRAQATWTFGGIVLLGADLAVAVGLTVGTGGAGMPAACTLVLTSVALGSTAALAGATAIFA